jgi:hypothetical protein
MHLVVFSFVLSRQAVYFINPGLLPQIGFVILSWDTGLASILIIEPLIIFCVHVCVCVCRGREKKL